MNIPMLQAYIEGYQEHLFDLQCLAVHQGYWAGYYQSKKPRPANVVLEKMIQEHSKAKKSKNKSSLPKPEVNVDQFLAREARRKAYMARRKRK